MYVPNEHWTGTDTFTYATLLGVDESDRATATLHVRKCRMGDCRNDIVDDVAFASLQ